MRTPSRCLGCVAAMAVAILAAPLPGHATCAPAGTPGDDTIVCTGADTAGVRSGEGNDVIVVQPGASVTVAASPGAGGGPAEANALAIHAGNGADSVVNDGAIGASAVAVSEGDAPSAAATGLAIGAGIPWFTGGGVLWGDTLGDVIRNAGSVAVTADSAATASVTGILRNTAGTSTADAAGIRTGQSGADVTNAGGLEVRASAQTRVYQAADSTHETEAASSYATAVATAVGIDAAAGDNRVRNDGSLRVDAVVQEAYAHAETWSGSKDTAAYAETRATATATGIATGGGKDDIGNAGKLTVVADTDAVAEALAQAPAGNTRYETANVSAIARAIGIDAGAGNNVIRNDGALTVRATATARASTFGGIGGFSIAFGATATGIKAGDGGSDIRNTGTIIRAPLTSSRPPAPMAPQAPLPLGSSPAAATIRSSMRARSSPASSTTRRSSGLWCAQTNRERRS